MLFDQQLKDLARRHPGTAATVLPSGTRLVLLPAVQLPAGWNRTSTDVRFLLMPGFPFAQPDCFWTDGGLLLASGGAPQNTGANPMPEVPDHGWLWFSWHLATPWNPSRDTLVGWYNSILDRLRRTT